VPKHVGLIKDYTVVCVVFVVLAFRWFGKNNKAESVGERKLMLNATFVDFGDLLCVNDA